MSLRGDFFLELETPKSVVTYVPKKSRVRTLMGSQDVKGSETLLKPAWQYFCRTFSPE